MCLYLISNLVLMNYKVKCFLGIRFAEELTNREWKLLYSDVEKLSSFYKINYKGNAIIDKVRLRFVKSNSDLKHIKKFVEDTNGLFLTVDKYLVLEFVATEQLMSNKIGRFFSLVEKRINDLIMAICIARKGGLEISGQSAILINDQFQYSIFPMIHGIHRAYQRSKKLKWPAIRNLSLVKTIQWIETFQEEIDGVSSTKIGRALNAFSHLFHRQGGEGSAAELFWALVGLETIYVDGNANLQGQVNSKSQLFLGVRKENKKAFNEMYDFRSRYIHGDLNFYNKFCVDDDTDEYKSFFYSVDDNESLAIAILIATFQKLIIKDWRKIEFDYKIKSSRK